MKLSQLSLADYNKLDSIPVINQDLSATDFTPVANTYYRHAGATTDTFTQGVIYYYDGTEYKALDGSSGGTELNHYTFTLDTTKDIASEGVQTMINIFEQCKGRVYVAMLFNETGGSSSAWYVLTPSKTNYYWCNGMSLHQNGTIYYASMLLISKTNISLLFYIKSSSGTMTTFSRGLSGTSVNFVNITINYWNDTEIT